MSNLENIERGKRIRKLRIAAGLNIKQLADKMDAHYQVISKLEEGKNESPRGNTLYNLIKSLNTTLDYIWTGKGFSTIKENLGNKIPILKSKDIIQWCMNNIKDIDQIDKEFISCPLNTIDTDMFAYKIISNSMQGANGTGFPKGSVIICRPSTKLEQNKYIIFYDRDENEIIIREVFVDGKTYLKPLSNILSAREMDENVSPIAEILAYVMITS